jgi:hypothetical protein
VCGKIIEKKFVQVVNFSVQQFLEHEKLCFRNKNHNSSWNELNIMNLSKALLNASTRERREKIVALQSHKTLNFN